MCSYIPSSAYVLVCFVCFSLLLQDDTLSSSSGTTRVVGATDYSSGNSSDASISSSASTVTVPKSSKAHATMKMPPQIRSKIGITDATNSELY